MRAAKKGQMEVGSPASGAFGSGVAVDDECLYVADTASGVYSVAKAQWTRAPMQ